MNLDPKKELQIESMDDALRNRIWNVLHDYMIIAHQRDYHSRTFFNNIMDRFFKLRVGKERILALPPSHYTGIIESHFRHLEWNRVYDFIEFVLDIIQYDLSRKMANELNETLIDEHSGYRIINALVSPIINPVEIGEINNAQNTVIHEANQHIETAVKLLSDRTNHDYRNSIKESISAVEAVCKKMANDKDTTLNFALDKIVQTKKISIDPHICEAIKKLYRYTNDASGIRHAMMDGKTQVGFDDAKFMLVTCSAITNYLIVKSDLRL